MAIDGAVDVLLSCLRGGGLAWLGGQAGLLSDASNLVFFQEINNFLKDEIDEFGVNLLGRMMAWVGSIALTLMTLWILIQGYRIVTGQSRDSMMALVSNSLRGTLIVGLATGLAIGGSDVYGFLADDMSREITHVVTGRDENAYASIDRSLGYMQVAMSSIDQLDVGGSEIVNDAKERALWFTGIGTGGPAITAGTMLLLNKIAMALFIGLGPLFVLCLLFDQTKQLFSRWLFYGIGTMFSLAVLSVMVALALDMVVAVAASFWTGRILGGNVEGINSMALQQGGLGLILTMLIISAPPIAASFFQGVLANFTPYSGFANPAGYSARDAVSSRVGVPGQTAPPGVAQPGASARVHGERPSDAAPMRIQTSFGIAPAQTDTVKERPSSPAALRRSERQ